ncbi:hypothetical protein IV493_07175 [Pantoea sp. SM3640]|uniref:hypothetical protein n=1 Tax=Pantoea sp. SM3640 TaxID=2787629 RepID=UPI0018A74758|nr:hypothetical protein [Pantoea sp. SM3640]QPG28587.1 hypothetical protein IV493_07175 [Pantoea sp. SM3640]
MSRFSESVKSGLLKATETARNIEQIDSIFQDLAVQVENTSNGVVTFKRVGSDPLVTWSKLVKPELNQKNSGRLALKNSKGALDIVAFWEQAADGYPFIIKYDGERHDCWDDESLVNILSTIVSSGAFWIRVQKLI